VNGEAAAVALDVHEQHDRLRSMLARLDAEAERVVRGETRLRAHVHRLFDAVEPELVAHLAFEEAALARTGDAAFARICARHAGQRDELARLARDVACADDEITLALELRAFVADLLLDMDAEDRAFAARRGTETT
jgi:hypothetical protein